MSDKTALSFHLLGGASADQVAGIYDANEEKLQRCAKCGEPLSAILAFCDKVGALMLSPLCAVHEGEVLAMIHRSKGYSGSSVVKVRER